MSASVVILLCAIACPASMALMMLFMRRSHGSSHTHGRRKEDELGDGDVG
jgi:hypothetical protein